MGGVQLAVVALGCAPPEELVKRKLDKKKMWDFFFSAEWEVSLCGFCLVLFCLWILLDSMVFLVLSLFNFTVLVCKQKVGERDRERRERERETCEVGSAHAA